MEGAGSFFQGTEEPSAAVDSLYTRIRADPRHTEILLVNTMENCERRMFPQWAMKTVRVASDDIRAEAIKLLLETAVEAHARLDQLSNGIERFVWAEMTGNPVQTLESTSS